MSNDIKGAHVFSAGTWNGLTFTEADLDGIVQAFQELDSAGRVPLKLGHSDEQPITDGQPALGWVQRLWRQGRRLMADFTGLPSAVYNSIRNGLHKYVSIELLRDAEFQGKKYPAVLDAVALLGADIPAVANLDDLQRLAHTRSITGTRLAFSRDFALPEDQPAAEDPAIQKLRNQITQLSTQLDAVKAERDALKAEREVFARKGADALAKAHSREIFKAFEDAVLSGRLTPAARDKLIKFKNLREPASCMKFSRDELELWLSEQARGHAPGAVTAKLRTASGVAGSQDEPVDELMALTRQKFASGGFSDIFAASVAAARDRPDLMSPVLTEWAEFVE
jgi:hypothetical protein